MEAFLESENPSKKLVAGVMAECCRNFRYKFSQFKVVYEKAKAQHTQYIATSFDEIQYAKLEAYQQAFIERCGGQ